jgi:hypothetical protein
MRALQQEVQEFVKHLHAGHAGSRTTARYATCPFLCAWFRPNWQGEGGSIMTNVLRTTVLLAALTALFHG